MVFHVHLRTYRLLRNILVSRRLDKCSARCVPCVICVCLCEHEWRRVCVLGRGSLRVYEGL